MKQRSLIVLIALAVLVLTAGTALAQLESDPVEPEKAPQKKQQQAQDPGNAPAAPEQVAESRELLEQVMVTRLSKRVGLTDEQTVELMRRASEIRETQQKTRQQRGEVLRKLKAIIKQEQDETALTALMKQLESLNQQIKPLPEEMRTVLDGFNLSVWQQARFEVFLSEFDGEMRRVMQQARGGAKSGQTAEGAPRPQAPRDAANRLHQVEGEGPGRRLREGGPAMPKKPDMPQKPEKPRVAPSPAE